MSGVVLSSAGSFGEAPWIINSWILTVLRFLHAATSSLANRRSEPGVRVKDFSLAIIDRRLACFLVVGLAFWDGARVIVSSPQAERTVFASSLTRSKAVTADLLSKIES